MTDQSKFMKALDDFDELIAQGMPDWEGWLENEKHIRLALRIADALTKEPTQAMLEVKRDSSDYPMLMADEYWFPNIERAYAFGSDLFKAMAAELINEAEKEK